MARYRRIAPKVSLSPRVVAVLAVVVMAMSGPAAGSIVVGSTVAVKVQATAGGDTGSAVWLFAPDMVISEHGDWTLPAPVTISANGKALAKINSITLGVDADPGVQLSFRVEAGDTDTTFTVDSILVPFAPIVNPLAYATAAATLTDQNGDGATLTGMYSGGKAYQAQYNAAPVAWNSLVSTFSADPDSSAVESQRFPDSGRATILDTVSSIRSQWHFTLSAYDTASGTSRFDVIPEPGALLLLGVGGLALILRRRA